MTDAATHTSVYHALESTKMLYRYRQWRSGANFDGKHLSPSATSSLAVKTRVRTHPPCCFRRDEKGVEMQELHYQYRRC